MSTDEIVSRRILDAPRDLVWRCLTEPAELAQYWGPAGMTTPADGIVVELRPGGRFETTMVGADGSHRMVAVFTEVVAPSRLAWVEPATGMRTTSTLEDLGDGTTLLVIRQSDLPDAMRTPSARAGFLTSLDKLGRHLDARSWVATTYLGLADLPVATWDAPSLCEKWLIRHVIAHVTMPVRFTPEQFGAEMAAAGGDFTVLSDSVALRDGDLPEETLLEQLRSPLLHDWQPPGGGMAGALNHAVIHSLDVTVALGLPAVAPPAAVDAVLEQLTATDPNMFGVALSDAREQTTDAALLVALLSGRKAPR